MHRVTLHLPLSQRAAPGEHVSLTQDGTKPELSIVQKGDYSSLLSSGKPLLFLLVTRSTVLTQPSKDAIEASKKSELSQIHHSSPPSQLPPPVLCNDIRRQKTPPLKSAKMSHDMDMDMDMDMGSDSSTGSSGHSMSMMAVFQNSRSTSLYSEAWTPHSTGTYAATCIFLIVFSALFRGLLALRSWQENRWMDAEMKRRYVVVAGQGTLADRISSDSLAKSMVLSGNGVEENVMVVQRHGAGARPFRLSVDPIRAVLDMVIAGVGYLL